MTYGVADRVCSLFLLIALIPRCPISLPKYKASLKYYSSLAASARLLKLADDLSLKNELLMALLLLASIAC